jgi:hypothetical protein
LQKKLAWVWIVVRHGCWLGMETARQGNRLIFFFIDYNRPKWWTQGRSHLHAVKYA